MRVRKLIKRLLATPMRRRHLFYARLLARLVVVPIELVLILVFARLAFDVRMTGSWLALVVVSVTAAPASPAWPPGRVPRGEQPDRQRPHEPGDAAHVRVLGRLLLVLALSRRACSP